MSRLLTTRWHVHASYTAFCSIAATPNRNKISQTFKDMRCTERPTNDEVAMAFAVPPDAAYRPDFVGRGAWIEHLTAPENGLVSAIIRESLDLPEPLIARLFQFGAVYTSRIPPNIPDALLSKLSAQEKEGIARRREAARSKTTVQDSRDTTIRRLDCDATVPQFSYIRVHLSPKRFPAFHSVDWTSRLISSGDDYVIISKPPHLPAVPTVDNLYECALSGAARAIGGQHALLPTSRLDHATEGVLVLGRTAEFVQQFNERLAKGAGEIRKFYRALVSASSLVPPVGSLQHHVRIGCRRQGTPFFTLVVPEDSPKAQFCELVVLGVEKIELSERAVAILGTERAYEVSIELVTGRTHQIRAQLSALGAPLLGDDLYGPLADATLRKRLLEGDESLEIVDASGCRLLAEPDGPIGLQACRLEVADGTLFGEQGPMVFEAGPPWWQE